MDLDDQSFMTMPLIRIYEQLDEIGGLIFFWVEERVCLVDAKDMHAVLHHLHDERSVLDWPWPECFKLWMPSEVPVIHCQEPLITGPVPPGS